MRGRFFDQGGIFSYIQPERRIPADHPLRKVRELVREVLKELSPTFGKLYSHEGRPSIPPEQLLVRCYCRCFTRDHEPELEQFTMDARGAPQWVLLAHALDEFA